MTKTKATKKRTVSAPGEATDPQSQDNFNQLYMAHQVHTLAQIVYQRLTRSPTVGLGFQPPFQGQQAGMVWSAPGMAGPACGMSQGPAPALFYWYP